MSNEEILKAFHMMWDNFPESVMITQRSREIVAVNKKAAELGLKAGIKCSSLGKPENHIGCQCNAACDTGEPQFCTYEGAFGKAYGYWIPIPKKPEWIIHFGVGHAFEYKKINRAPSKKAAESLHGLTKGTELEPTMAAMAAGVVTLGPVLDGNLTEGKSKMKISAVKLFDGGFMMKSFACGGGLPAGAIKEEKLRSSLQNYVIDTGKEVILVDTGFPAEETFPVTADSVITFGDKVNNYVDALKAAGYAPDKVSKILVTHKHPDHTGELRAFPNAKIYISRIEADDMKLTGDNVVRVDFNDGAYKNFPACQKIADGVYYIFAPGHTKGNSIVIVEDGDLFYMIHGDVTYTDEALLENKLSVANEDLTAARDTLNKVRAFMNENKTVYLSTHTPLGYENLDAQKIMELPDVEETPAIEEKSDAPKATGTKWVCSVCGYEHFGDEPPEVCPRCKQPKSAFKKA